MRKMLGCTLLLIAGMATGCGPAKSTTALMRARSAIRQAESSIHAKDHVYELTLAREYYNKAREEAGYSEYEAAAQLAREARKFANKAMGPVDKPEPEVKQEEAPSKEAE